MNLGATTLALSILGFNIGIELMQLCVIAMIIPWLVLFSKTSIYKWFRIAGASLAGIAALGWIVERCTGKANFITNFIAGVYPYAVWFIIAIAVLSVTAYVWHIYYFKRGMFKVINRAL